MPQRRLVVLVPGMNGHSRLWQPLIERLSKEPGFGPHEAVWLAFDHHLRWHTPGRLATFSRRLNALISARWIASGDFSEVLLIGHSVGGLIARHAYLSASGAVQGSTTEEWAAHVKRIVLMASPNRGVELKSMSLPARVGSHMLRLTPLPFVFAITDALRGSDFLTNLRIDWIRHFASFANALPDGTGGHGPVVVQLLGTDDGLVSPDDSKDVLAFPAGKYLTVPEANHRAVYRLDLSPDPELRYGVLRRGLIGTFPDDTQMVPDPVSRVVFILHGIRASNVDDWVGMLKKRIKARENDRVVVKNPTYGFFSALRFALPSVRKKNIRIFQDWYTEELAKHPRAQFDVIAHSNGTYVLGHSLLHTPGMRFSNIALAGSVLPEDFWQRFENLSSQAGRIRNDRASHDVPVAILCNMLHGLRMRDVGTAGFSGFLGNVTHEVAYHAGGHSEALRETHLDALAEFALDGSPNAPLNLTTPGYFRQVSNSAPYIAQLLVVLLLGGLGYLLHQGLFGVAETLYAILALALLYVALDIA